MSENVLHVERYRLLRLISAIYKVIAAIIVTLCLAQGFISCFWRDVRWLGWAVPLVF